MHHCVMFQNLIQQAIGHQCGGNFLSKGISVDRKSELSLLSHEEGERAFSEAYYWHLTTIFQM